MLIFAVTMVAARFWPALMRWFGGVERAFCLTAIVWFTVFAAACAINAR